MPGQESHRVMSMCDWRNQEGPFGVRYLGIERINFRSPRRRALMASITDLHGSVLIQIDIASASLGAKIINGIEDIQIPPHFLIVLTIGFCISISMRQNDHPLYFNLALCPFVVYLTCSSSAGKTSTGGRASFGNVTSALQLKPIAM